MGNSDRKPVAERQGSWTGSRSTLRYPEEAEARTHTVEAEIDEIAAAEELRLEIPRKDPSVFNESPPARTVTTAVIRPAPCSEEPENRHASGD